MDKNELEETAALIKDNRSNEANFEKLCAALQEAANNSTNIGYKNALQEINEKQAGEYRKAKQKGGTAWPEFEKFVSEFEKTVVNALSETR